MEKFIDILITYTVSFCISLAISCPFVVLYWVITRD